MKKTALSVSIALGISQCFLLGVAHSQVQPPKSNLIPFAQADRYDDSFFIKVSDLDAHNRGLDAVQKLIDSAVLSKSLLQVLGKNKLTVTRKLGRSFWVVEVSGKPSDLQIDKIMKELTTGNRGVLYAEPNMFVHSYSYNDTLWQNDQKVRFNTSKQFGYDHQIASILEKFPNAGAGNIISIVDTGKVLHSDLSPIVGEVSFRNSTDTPEEKADSTAGGKFNCGTNNSAILHGLNMSSIASSLRNNNLGIIGTSTSALYSVRSLPTCSGSGTSLQVFDGILWSAGLDMEGPNGYVQRGYPLNTNPATVINLSLGSLPLPDDPPPCQPGSAVREVTDRAIAAGSMIVAAAGNEYSDFYASGPFEGQRAGIRLNRYAYCPSVVSAGALDIRGDHAFYSNIPRSDERLVTSVVTGGASSQQDTTLAGTSNDRYENGVGTSQSTALISGLLSSVISIVGEKRPSNDAFVNLIASTGTPFNTNDSVCGQGNCGTRLMVAELIKAIDNSIDLDPVFTKSIPASTFNLPDLGKVIAFEDTEGTTTDLAVTISDDKKSLTVSTKRKGMFSVRVGSVANANGTNAQKIATAEVIVNNFGDVSVSLVDAVKNEVETPKLAPGAARVLSVSNFNFISGSYARI